jgi:hypothetical protein
VNAVERAMVEGHGSLTLRQAAEAVLGAPNVERYCGTLAGIPHPPGVAETDAAVGRLYSALGLSPGSGSPLGDEGWLPRDPVVLEAVRKARRYLWPGGRFDIHGQGDTL